MSVSNNNLFSGPFFIPSGELQSAFAGTNTASGSVSIDGGQTTGNVFNGDAGGDFLNPNKVQDTLNNFGNSIGGSSMIFGDNPNSLDILRITRGNINDIFAADFFPAFNKVRVLNHPSIQPIPDISGNIGAADILAASTFFQVGVELSPALYNPLQQNPYLWNGPSANDIFTGSLISQSNIISGNFSWPNNFPNSLIGTGGVHMANPFPQFTGLPYFGNVFGNPYGNPDPFGGMGSMMPGMMGNMMPGMMNNGYDPFNMGGGGLLSGFNYPGMNMGGGGYPGLLGSPMAGSASIQPFGNQVSMLDYIFNQSGGLMGNMMQSLFTSPYGGGF